jgi:hypothetical protein
MSEQPLDTAPGPGSVIAERTDVQPRRRARLKHATVRARRFITRGRSYRQIYCDPPLPNTWSRTVVVVRVVRRLGVYLGILDGAQCLIGAHINS